MENPPVCKEVQTLGWLGRLRVWFKRQVVTDVPSGIARCEFECRLAECSSERISNCKNRIAYADMLSSEEKADQ